MSRLLLPTKDAQIIRFVRTTLPPGENLNIAWSPSGKIIAIGNKDDLVTFVEYPGLKKISDKQFKCEVTYTSITPAFNLPVVLYFLLLYNIYYIKRMYILIE